MFFWYIALSCAGVLLVFDSPRLDYRLIALGSVLPILDRIYGPPYLLHTVFAPVIFMASVMILAWGRRRLQRRLLGIPIGMFAHLVLAGTWQNAERFWWPIFKNDKPMQMLSTPWFLAMELTGLIVGLWLWRRTEMANKANRTRFIRTGHLPAHITNHRRIALERIEKQN